ncbi:metalloregulator ArsR/SmtB family transcription factor [Spongiactinospora sp. TRM90649]|uniref:ArsR/SmtB family transcription factor n=1 Tax=Spongiactinospora sp. TRM90649 TaxID=3031114 RepID=UPI0023F97F6A|nr:metalloregulator ArsR/SmtB family transcription factor [Spongiactinospora sp. TRM90649]MDF5754528.1 metalloregulator ArsR/SmtB family transcription factor [Spongiactinospora sp. TRM90649]
MVAQVPSGPPVVSVDAIVEVLKAIADPIRFQILKAVSGQECHVGQLAEKLGAHVAAVSQHLARLRSAGLVSSRREGTRIYYRTANSHVGGLLNEAGLLTGYVTGVLEDDAAPPATTPPRPNVILHPRHLHPV